MIELKNVTKKYSTQTAVNKISLKIKTGEIVGLLGPNGAGKSTTMKVISGFIVPDEGNVVVENIDVKENPVGAKSKIGYMPENNPLYKDMLVKDAITYALELHSIAKADRKERIKYVVAATGLEKVYYRPINELSKGYKQRVGLALVLVHDPKVLILDEPTEGLDPNQRTEIRNLIKKLGKDRTVIISTHVMQEVEAMCSRIIIINKGEIVKDAKKEDLAKSNLKYSLINLKIKSTKSKVNLKFKSEVEVAPVKASDKSMYEFEIKAKDTDKFFEELTDQIKKNDWIVYELKQEQQNLEDLFKELTK
jgi:ABC-2 type transport system ATP-binding protein